MSSTKPAAKAGGNVIYSVGSWRLGDDGSIHRRGRLKYSTGDVYDGEWVDGKRHGQGVLTFGSGGSYTGEFANDLFEGFGVLRVPKSQHPLTKQWTRREKYEGEFLRGLKHGRGTWQTRSGDQYDGELKQGLYDGRGVCVYGASGDVYDGEFVRGQRYGRGELRFRNGSIYSGGFRLDNFHGYGRMSYGPGGIHGTYIGDFVDGKRHGQGVRTYGNAEANKTNMRRYEGAWEDDEPHGTGVLERDGCTAVGIFERGLQKGPGAMRFANGDTYDGNFENGDLHGEGRYVYRDGGIYEGTFVRSKRHGNGIRVFSNGDQFVGDWVDDQMHGKGMHTSTIVVKPRGKSKNGGRGVLVYSGEYANGHQTGTASISYEFTPYVVEVEAGPEVQSPTKWHQDSSQQINWEWKGEYEFPQNSGCWHRGRGKTIYEGGVLRGRFHGQGKLLSPDGKLWRGEWAHGQLHGHGERVYLPLELDTLMKKCMLKRDTPDLMLAAGGPIGLYGVVQYVGEFVKNVRHGEGELLYTNGYHLRGHFVNGFVDGVACYIFGGQGESARWRFGEFVRGERKRWLEKDEEAIILQQKKDKEATEALQHFRLRTLLSQ
ncbi:unnamed protein product [Phytophthora fragariaefolia]|uniref:Unnamed protein product n=1 Tax=Phytophthora fragariaefolia TaxID=1490495 RepID=A0A9W6WYH0_9STRA|nr:unnamed protein product [Phytophthora fragariaefolia]